MPSKQTAYSLREKKYAKTKIALANAFIARLKTTRFHDISIKEVCASVEVSEATFFNYFPQKIDVVFYFQQIFNLRLSSIIRGQEQKMSALKRVHLIFDCVAQETDQPYLLYEIVSLFTAEHKKPKAITLTAAEKFYAYPNDAAIDDIKPQTIEEIFLNLVTKAKKDGEFKKGITSEDIVVTLMAILVGVPLVIDIKDFGKLKAYYRSQLTLLWKATGV